MTIKIGNKNSPQFDLNDHSGSVLLIIPPIEVPCMPYNGYHPMPRTIQVIK
jgi:hypothetical protein